MSPGRAPATGGYEAYFPAGEISNIGEIWRPAPRRRNHLLPARGGGMSVVMIPSRHSPGGIVMTYRRPRFLRWRKSSEQTLAQVNLIPNWL